MQQTALKIVEAIGEGQPRLAYAEVADSLRQMILSGQLQPGERLPGEAELSQLLRVSRSTIREAIRVLSSEKLLQSVRGAGGGTFVTKPRIDDISVRLAAMLGLASGSEGCSIDELVETRKVLEVWAAEEAARNATPDAVDDLQHTLPVIGTRLKTGEIYASNHAFHVALLAAAQNGVVAALAEPIFTALHHRIHRPSQRRNEWSRGIEEHHEISKAISQGDPETSGRLMAEHLERLKPLYSDLEKTK